MEQVINRAAAQPIDFSYSGSAEPALDDNWIIQEMFGIRTLENRVSRALANCGGCVNDSLYAMIAELNARAANFDELLDMTNPAAKPMAKAMLRRAC
ncbi:MAG TPA: hypothetical protein VKS01_03355 [Bryobacteraceae bacterium]|nr:hypothetical protein [Bryobacteraceae bacterium]